MNPTDYCTWPSLAAGVEKAIDFPFTLLMAKFFSHKAERYVMITPITKPANTVTPYRQSLLFDKTNSPFFVFYPMHADYPFMFRKRTRSAFPQEI